MERFIAAVRRYPCLWNTAAVEYRDQELKDAAWAELMNDTDLSSVKEVKLKWKKLRDSYRDALKRQSGGGGGVRPPPWRYSAHMRFLQPHMSRRRAPPPPPPPAPEPPPEPLRSEPSPPPSPPAPPAPADPLTAFFSGMCEATRRLPAHAQIHVKKTLFGAVIAAEEAQLAARRSSSSGSDSPDDAASAPL